MNSSAERANGVNVRTEGQRLLLEVPASLSEVAKVAGVGKTVVSYWRNGSKLPGPGPRVLLADAYGIDPSAWERVPSTGDAEEPKAPASRERGELPGGKPTTLGEVEAQIDKLRDLQDEKGLMPSEQVRLADSMGKLLAIKARLERDQELLEDKIVRQHPLFRRLCLEVLETLERFPDAMRAVAEKFREPTA